MNRNRNKLTWILCLLMAITGVFSQAAEIEDLQKKLAGLGKDLKSDMDFDKQIIDIRDAINQTEDPEERSALYAKWRNVLADRVVAQDDLNARLTEALRAAQGLPASSEVDVTDITTAFEVRMDSLTGHLDDLQARSTLMKNKGELAAKFSKPIDVMLKVQRQMMQNAREGMRELLDKGQGKASSGDLITTLEAMLTFSQARELSRQFEFALAAQLGDMHDMMSEVSKLFNNLMNGKDFQAFMTSSSMTDIATANQLEEMMDTFVSSTGAVGFDLSEEEVNSTVEEIESYANLMSYRSSGKKFYFDTERERWYTRDAKGRIYMPVDSENGSGKFIRVHEDGIIYSEVPGATKPLRLMSLEDWLESYNKPLSAPVVPATTEAPATVPVPAPTEVQD